jgi:hypothetical protein
MGVDCSTDGRNEKCKIAVEKLNTVDQLADLREMQG